MKKIKLFVGFALVLGLIVGNLWLYILKPAVNDPDLIFQTLKGERIALSDISDKPVLVTFWATSCGVCMADLPKLEALHQRYASKGLQMFSVAMPYDDVEQVKRVAKNLPFNVVLDGDAIINQAFGKVNFTPTNILIDLSGRAAFKGVGPIDTDRLEDKIKAMI